MISIPLDYSKMIVCCLLVLGVIPDLISQNDNTSYNEPSIKTPNQWLAHLRQSKELPGISGAVVIDGKLIWAAGEGYADIEGQQLADPNTIYRIASVSKVITVAIAAQMVQKGKITWKDKVAQYLEFPNKEITIEHLANHTSGIRHYNYGERVEQYKHFDSVSEAIVVFKNDTLQSGPGEKFKYSSYGIDLLGAVLEQASGESFETLVDKYLLTPLELKDIFTDDSNVPSEKLTKFYSNDDSILPDLDLSYNIPGGGIYASAKALAKFGYAHFDGHFFSSETQLKLFTKSTLNNGDSIHYGLGWMIESLSNGKQIFYHNGHMDGAHSILALFPEHHASIAVICNRGSNWGIEELNQLSCIFLYAGDCPDVLQKTGYDPKLAMHHFQKLTVNFERFQEAVSSKDKQSLNQLISDNFSSLNWEDKSVFIQFLCNKDTKIEWLDDQDINLRGMEEGDLAYIRTITFINLENGDKFFLELMLEKNEWLIKAISLWR